MQSWSAPCVVGQTLASLMAFTLVSAWHAKVLYSAIVSSHPSLHLCESSITYCSESPTALCDSISGKEH